MLKRKNQKKVKEKFLEKPEEKNLDVQQGVKNKKSDLANQIKESVEGLYYISETDAEILPFVGKPSESVTAEVLLSQIGNAADTPVEERNFNEFFARLTEIQDWFGDEEKEIAQKFGQLKGLLENNLKDLKVFKIGKIELDIYVVGLDAEGNISGVMTKAVET